MPPSGIDFPPRRGALMSWNGSCLDYFRRTRVGSGTGAAAKARRCAVSGEIVLPSLGILFGFLALG